MSNHTNLRLTIEGHVATITFDNPPANTWTCDSLAALRRLVAELDADSQVLAVVLTGQGNKFFSAGADLKQFSDGDKALARETARRFGEAFEALSAFRGVTIAAISGYAMGGGLEVALAADLRIAEEQALLALPETSVGLLPCAGGTQNLTRLVGEGWAKRLILLGERIDAATALLIGLVEEVVPAGTALSHAQALAAKACKQSPDAVASAKRLIQAQRTQTHATGLILEREYFVDLFDGMNQQEGVRAFLEKRAPRWTFKP